MTTGLPRLLAAARDGDEHAFETLWRGVQPGLDRYLRVVAPSAHGEVTARVWIEVLHVLPRFRGGFTAWRISLYRTARAAGRGTFRTFEPRTSRDARLPDAMTSAALVALAAMPADLGEAVALRYAAGLSLSEIAAVLGRPEAEVAAAVKLGTGVAAAVVLSPELRRAAEHGRLPSPLPEPAEPGPHLLAALAAPASAAERAAWPETLAAFRAAVPVRPHHALPVGKVGVLAAAATIGLSGVAAAAYTGNLPAPLQGVAHNLLDAPAPASSSGGQPRPAHATGAPSAPRPTSQDGTAGKPHPSPTHAPHMHASPDPHATSHPAPVRSDHPTPTHPPQPTPSTPSTPSTHATTPHTHPRSTPPRKPTAPPGERKQPGTGTGHP